MMKVYLWDWDCEMDFCEFIGSRAECLEFVRQNGLVLMREDGDGFYCE